MNWQLLRKLSFCFVTGSILVLTLFNVSSLKGEHTFNGIYTDRNLDRIAFPIGGLGTGMYCLEGTGTFSHVSLQHHLEFFHEPVLFGALYLKDRKSGGDLVRVLEGPIPDHKYFGGPGTGLGAPGTIFGLPRFTNAKFSSNFPFCDIHLTDKTIPVEVVIQGFSPFIPNEPELSSFPAGTVEYRIKNTSGSELESVFSFHARNFMGNKEIGSIDNGFRLVGPNGEFAIKVMDTEEVHVDHCWYRGGWWDGLTMTWNNVMTGKLVDNPPVHGNEPGASLYVPLHLAPGKEKVVRLLTCWYVPKSDLVVGNDGQNRKLANRPALGTAEGQQTVHGYHGKQLVNTYFPDGDSQIGTIRSPKFTVKYDYLHFLVGGGVGDNVGIALIDSKGKRIRIARGQNQEDLQWTTWPLSDLKGESVYLEIFDNETGPWGHINADYFVLSEQDHEQFLHRVNSKQGNSKQGNIEIAGTDQLVTDFEAENYDNWTLIFPEIPEGSNDSTEPKTYKPWYAVRYASLDEVVTDFIKQYDMLYKRSRCFSELFRRTTLPNEILEAVEANLTILKSPTILRQHDGRLWAWEGNGDNSGSCAGTCTHVWNYAQSICHLFPELERGLRQTEFFDALMPDGRQAFRAPLPIRPGWIAWDASDGQLGCIMKVHREWRISGDMLWLKHIWPRVQTSMNYAIEKWDPKETGLLEESHHNTYDINYLGPEGHCGSFYLGALAAIISMGKALNENVERYEKILRAGRFRMENELFNGEYFIQLVPTPGTEGKPDNQSLYYKEVARQIDQQGPKYQYGTGCLSDGVLGFWMAKVCGIDEDLVDPKKVRSHLNAVYKYNLKKSLLNHSNPQRPSYAMGDEGGLLLCSWPRGGKPLLPFVYSDEVWTGIEYQVASHLMMVGETEKGLEIVRICRNRYCGIRRNPYNEFECGHWYARAMASFALLQGFTGVRYDAVSKTLYVRKSTTDFIAPLFTNGGYGYVRYDASNQKESVKIEPVEGLSDFNPKIVLIEK